MLAWALAKGVPPQQIVVDRNACNTVDNAWQVARLLAEHRIAGEVDVVTSRFHLPRSKHCFEPILTAYQAHGLCAIQALNFVSASDAYDEEAYAERMRIEESCIESFKQDIKHSLTRINTYDPKQGLSSIPRQLYQGEVPGDRLFDSVFVRD